MKLRKAQGTAAKPQERDRRLSIFLWALLISFVCGVIEFGQPLEDVIQAARDSVRSQPAEQHIVVAGIDDKTIHELGGSAYPRVYDAQAIDRLIALGANRILYDSVFADPTNPAQDAAFAAALKRHPGRVFIGTMSPKDMTSGKYVEVWPQPEFMRSARLISLNGKTSPFGFSARLPFRGAMERTSIPSMSTVLAHKDIRSTAFYKPDWSIEARTIPTISVTDIVHGRVTREQVAGKDIVVGIT
jgi:CHASE2 domain-containing sensor protein